ncbi:Na+/H+ antiporter subunit E [Litoribacillus peritrichatus]|uniref:Na+/H+ antiporter subunit E n=1 Tax=Litoribacillus peritrichatus TaxID=718191 RepID=A0ABP7M9Z8_9GAMM
MHIVKWAALLTVFWVLLSGYIQPLLLSFGAVSIAVVLVVLKRMDAVDQEPKHVSSGFQMFRYLAWLAGQVVSSSIHVTKLIWGSPDKLSPSLAKVSIKNVTPKAHVLYANSITLTPGTLSVDLKDGEVTVHALEKASIDQLEQGDMERKIISLWSDKK